MTDFQDFYNDLITLVSKYEKNNLPLKIEKDLENDIVKIFGEHATSLVRAKNGLNDISELALTTAEHHPFWNLLYRSSEISTTVLEKWRNALSSDDIGDIEWAIKELTHTLNTLKEKTSSDI